MIEAERFDHNLTLQFGLLSYECANETIFIEKSVELIHELMTYEEEEIDDLFFGSPPNKTEFHNTLNKILNNISKL